VPPPPPSPPAPGTGTGEATLSVVLCTHGRPKYLRACLAGLAGQSRREFEVLVVDSASAPAEAAAVARLAAKSGVRLLRTDEPGLSRARNLGLAEAGGSWVAFLDDDAVPEPGWAAALLNRIAVLPERAAALGGRILPAWEEPLPGWWPPSLRGVLTIIEWEGFGEVGVDLPAGIDIYGANMAFAAPPLREIGGFEETLGRVGNRLLSGEEVEVVDNLRARGYRAFYEGAAAVRHSIQRERLRPGWLLSRLLWQGATDALRDRAGGNGQRRLLGAAARLLVQAPLLLWPATSSALLRARCGAAYNLGYLRGRFAGAA
jgi:glycosyltransferase involved in cell wall biosynthesis